MKSLLMALIGLLLVGSLANAEEAAKAAAAPAAKKASDIVLTKDNTITLNAVFYGETVANLAVKAKELDSRTDSTDPIYLVLNSPGGGIDAGLELIEILSNLKRPVKTISMFSASMGFQTVQSLGERLVVVNGTLMAHKARGGFYGEFPGQLDSRYGYYLKRVNRMNEQAVKRTNGKHTLTSFNALVENEFWCDGSDCVEQGFADRVISPSCDKSLEGKTTVVEDKFLYRGYKIEFVADYDNCPINTNALSWNILIDGEPLLSVKAKEDEDAGYIYQARRYLGYRDDNENRSGSGRQPLTSEDLFTIQQKAEKMKTDKQNRMVVKGY